jgi:hypothetical protein
MTGSLGKDVCMYVIISHLILLGMRNVPDKRYRENKKKHIFCLVTFFSKNRSVYWVMWENEVQPDRSHMTM